MKNSLKLFALVFILIGAASSIHSQELTVRQIMAEPSIAGQRVEGEKISPDGTKVIYLWSAEGKPVRDLYLVSTNGGDAKIILRTTDLPTPAKRPEKENKLNYGLELRDDFTKARENQLGNFEWSPDSTKLLFSHGGDLYIMTLADSKTKRYTKTESGEFGANFIDNDRIMYRSNGDIFILNTADSTTTQITKEADPAKNISVGNAVVTKDGTLAAYVVSDSSKYRSLVVPNYLGEYVTAGTRRRGWSDQKLFVTPTDGSRDKPFEIELPKQQGVGGFRRIVWAADNASLIVDRGDMDTKRRQLFYVRNAGAKNQQIVLVTEETDPKWLAPLSYIVEPNPKNADQLFFASERDGFNHLYLATLHSAQTESQADEPIDANGDAKVTGTEPPLSVKVEQLTKGNWQVEWAKWTSDCSVLYSSTKSGTEQRDLRALRLPERKELFMGLSSEGMVGSLQTSDPLLAEINVLFEFSRWNVPGELYVLRSDHLRPIMLTSTVPKGFAAKNWNEPKFVSIPSRDGKNIPAKIYLPAGHNAKAKYPMIVFIHGAGYLQNVINGWNNYYREFMFNELLTQKGYVVLDIDYRGSAGYGRDWRTDVYDFLGGKDMDDHVDAIDFMVANYNVNKDNVGVYGGSYGGFMAGMLAMRASDKVAAAAALRPVFDWKNYYESSPGYTAQRLGFPDKNPEAYKRSSPITYAEKLERPLLILHGMSDDNVPVQDSVQLIEKLIRLGKTDYFEAMLYPSENHGFVRPESWTDEYSRILAFFEKHLK